MKPDAAKHHRRSIRIKEYDYSRAGAYYVTICVEDRECLFGEIENSEVNLSAIGQIASDYWLEIQQHFENAELDEFVVTLAPHCVRCSAGVPNHLHGVIVLDDAVGVEYTCPGGRCQGIQPLPDPPLNQHAYQHVISKSIGSIIRSYKAAVTRWCNANGHDYFRWQRNYYEHIVRNETKLNRIRQYISDNPFKWNEDDNHPENINLVQKHKS